MITALVLFYFANFGMESDFSYKHFETTNEFRNGNCMLQTDCVGKSKPTKQSWEGVGCRASHPLLTAKDGAPSVVLGYWGRKVGHPPAAEAW
jgi:hypothetical protein